MLEISIPCPEWASPPACILQHYTMIINQVLETCWSVKTVTFLSKIFPAPPSLKFCTVIALSRRIFLNNFEQFQTPCETRDPHVSCYHMHMPSDILPQVSHSRADLRTKWIKKKRGGVGRGWHINSIYNASRRYFNVNCQNQLRNRQELM